MSTPSDASATADRGGRWQRDAFRRIAVGAGVLLATTSFGALAIAGIGALHMRAASQPERLALPPVSVSVATVRIDTCYLRKSAFAGRIEPARQTPLAFERAGLVTTIMREEGDSVAPGDIVAQLDTAQLTEGRRRLEARRRELEAQRRLAELTLSRQSRLSDQGWSSEQRRDEAEARLAELSAGIEQVSAEIASINIDLEKSQLRAPFGGRVAARMIDEGAVIAPGMPVLVLMETARPQARIGLPPDLAASLENGRSYVLTSNGRALPGRLVARRPDLETGTRTVTALFDITDDWQGPLGELVTLELEAKVEVSGAWLPLSALKEGQRGLWTVLVVDDGPDAAKVRREAVEVLHANGAHAYVRGTLSDGDRIIAAGTDRVVAGQLVALAQE